MLKKLKISFAAILAIVAISAALISKADVLSGKALVTGCFATITLTNATGTPNFSPVVDQTDCEDVQNTVDANSYIYLKAISNTTQIPTGNCVSDIDFCCVQLTDFVDASIPVPTFDLGDGVQRKYRLTNQSSINVLCRP